jgi:hypothetical protein
MNIVGTFLLALLLIAMGLLAMAVGVIFKRPCLRGSCGGREVTSGSGESLSCATCPNRRQSSPQA